mgnify:CR=1 FL=1
MSLRKTPLFERHEDQGARFTEFGGWSMPVEYESITAEHETVREAAGKFDVSHMGQVRVRGADAEQLLQRLTSNDITALEPGDSHYSMITNEAGVILDDTIVYCLAEENYLFIPNAGHDEQMTDRWITHRDRWDLEATVDNVTEGFAMVAVQGPEAIGLVNREASESVKGLSRFEMREMTVAGVDCRVARTGYTGEDGVEILLPTEHAPALWDDLDCEPIGLGARDTLRTEMGYLLSGQDFHPEDEPRNPYEAGVGFTVQLDTDFVGRDALERVDAEGVEERFIGVMLIDRGIPRHGYEVLEPGGESIGHLTSGTMSPTLGEPIGLGYIDVDHTEPDTLVHVEIRDEPKKAKIRAPPFLPGK